jgi:hypothetical protein
MSISLSFRLQTSGDFAALSQEAEPLLFRLVRLLATARQRHLERQIALAVEDLGHSGVLADLRRATRPWMAPNKRDSAAMQKSFVPGVGHLIEQAAGATPTCRPSPIHK